MTDERPDETRADTALDREIEELLAVEPSPEFLARIRARVAAEPEPGSWQHGWWWLAAGATAVGVLAVAVAVSRPGPPEETRDPPRVADVAPAGDARLSVPTVTLPPGPEDVASPAAPPPPPQPILDDPAATAPPEPAPVSAPAAPAATGPPQFARVVISQSEAAALRQLFTQVSDGRLAVPAPVEPSGPAAPPEPPAEVTIPPVIIEPVTLALIEGALQ